MFRTILTFLSIPAFLFVFYIGFYENVQDIRALLLVYIAITLLVSITLYTELTRITKRIPAAAATIKIELFGKDNKMINKVGSIHFIGQYIAAFNWIVLGLITFYWQYYLWGALVIITGIMDHLCISWRKYNWETATNIIIDLYNGTPPKKINFSKDEKMFSKFFDKMEKTTY